MAAAAIGSDKARRGRAGRRQWRRQLASLGRRTVGECRVHIHAASVGEFEQAKPIIEAMRARVGAMTVTASFFSPSGYEQQGRYAGVDAACYLPNDTAGEMRAFLDAVDPDAIIIIRYDLWPGMLAEARRRSIPVILVCGVLHGNSSRFNPLVRPFFAWLYGQLSMIHAVGGG
jgi:3-deoxy-D-manno-octulosonic-acid transferase